MKKAYSYIRFSSEKQAEGDSLRRQFELSNNYAEKHSLQLVENYQDLGISAFKGANKENALGDFIKAVKDEKIEKGSVLLVENLDRISREAPTKAFNQFVEILELGIDIITLQDNQTYTYQNINSDTGKLFTSIAIMLRANNESEAKSQRLKGAWENKRKKANNELITSICPNWLKVLPDRKGFEVIQEAEKAIKVIFEMALKGYGCYKIVQYLTKNVKPLSTKIWKNKVNKPAQWHESYVKRILRNEALIGIYRPSIAKGSKRIPTGEEIDGYYPVIIDPEDFQKVQDILDNRKGGRKGVKYSNVFAGGMLKCGFCGDTIGMFNKGLKNGKDRVGLVCKTKIKGGKCCYNVYNYDEFETDFFRFISEIDINDILDNPKISDENQRLEALRNKQSADEKRKNDALKRLEESDFNADVLSTINKQVNNLNESIQDTKIKIKAIEEEIEAKRDESITSARNDVITLSDRLKGIEEQEKVYEVRQLINNRLKTLIKEIKIYSEFKIDPYVVYNDGSYHEAYDESYEEETIPKAFTDIMISKGYKTQKQQYEYLKTTRGQANYNKFERYFIVWFRNGKSIEVKPSSSFVFKRDDERLIKLMQKG